MELGMAEVALHDRARGAGVAGRSGSQSGLEVWEKRRLATRQPLAAQSCGFETAAVTMSGSIGTA